MKPSSKEEAWALIENLVKRQDNQQKEIEDLQARVKMLEAGKVKRKPTADATRTTQNRLADIWIEIYKGKPRGDLFRIGTRLVREYGWERVEPVLRWKFKKTSIDYLSLSKIESAFAVFEAEMRANGGSDDDDPLAKGQALMRQRYEGQ